ncbi:MAG TPA: hypothetical protein VG603_10940 [Chitinophagales bacterium]|nr:hypothetical protein [Chitinophagales bacterium]
MADSEKIIPLNTEWNRKTNMLPETGKLQLQLIHNGTAYFSWTDLERGPLYMQCEENFFNKNFKLPGKYESPPKEEALKKLEGVKKHKLLKYPFDVVAK